MLAPSSAKHPQPSATLRFLSLCLITTVYCLSTHAADTFRNPLLPSGADPWVLQYNGFYYYTNTTGRNLTLWKTRDISDLAHAQKKIIWTPPPDTPYSKEIWAPELHRFDSKWFMYFAADDGQNRNHRLYVIENDNEDPLTDGWKFQGKIADTTDKWAIDASAFEANGKRYLIWSGWKGSNNAEQDIYIAELATPTKIGSPRVLLSSPTYNWEKQFQTGNPNSPHVFVNEGPELLQHNDKLFLIYSASGCWTDDYKLGMLEADATANLLDPKSWKKSDRPVFQKNPEASVFGPGHNGFFTTSDGKQDWIIYHANSAAGEGCGHFRSPRIQPFTWNPDGTPNFGKPLSTESPIEKPSP